MAIDPTTGLPLGNDPLPQDDAGTLMQFLMSQGVTQQGQDPEVVQTDTEDVVPREPPDLPDRRKRLVAAWCGRVSNAKAHWKYAYDRMREDEQFCQGKQWSTLSTDKRYVANLTLRLVAQKTAFLYAKNPKAVARKRERIDNTAWDGTETQLQQLLQAGTMIMQQAAMGMQSPMGGAMPAPPPIAGAPGPMGEAPVNPAAPPGFPPGVPPGAGGIASMMGPGAMAMMQPAMAIMQDAAKVKAQHKMLDGLCKTLELLYSYNVAEQVHPFKSMMKLVVRRTVTVGVGYVKLGFERVMGQRPDMEQGIAEASERLATLERLSADMTDDMFDENAKEAEQLRLLMQDLKNQSEFVTREGLTFDFPLPTNIIPDTKTIELRHFLGADWVAEEFMLSPYEVQEIYGVDVGESFTSYSRTDLNGPDPIQMAQQMANGVWVDDKLSEGKGGKSCCVWQIYSRKDGLVYEVCEGYPDFLREPAAPEIYNERFWPWYPLLFNECVNEGDIFPPSDVRLMMDMQKEYNRCREGLKEHRIAARPFTAVVAGALDEGDLDKISNREANDVIELNALQPNQDVKNLLQPYSGPGIDPNLYEVNPIYEDILRTTGIQEANLGGVTQDATATQSQIAEGSRQTSMGSNIDDLTDLLTALARNGGQILLSEVDQATVQKVVGAGAVWPQMTKQDIMQEVLLEIEAGSMGRPNAAQEIANAQRIYPLLIQIPGIDPNYLAKDLLRRLDDRLDLTQAFKSQLPSIVAMNGMVRGQTGGGPGLPGAGAGPGAGQGAQGAANAEKPSMPGAGGPPDQTQQLTGAGPRPKPQMPGSPTLQ